MSTQSVSVRYRPVRIGFLIESGNISSLVKAAEINTILWGGIHNPIIAVDTDVKKARELIELFNVDVLFPVDSSETIKKIVEEDKFRSLPMLHSLFYEDWYTKKQELAVLDVINLFDCLWEKEFKLRSRTYKSRFRVMNWSTESDLDKLFTLRYGRFPSKQLNLKYEYEELFLGGLKGVKTEVGKTIAQENAALRFINPILTTSHNLTGYFGEGANFGVYFGDHNSFDDLLYFWNLRAGGMILDFIPETMIAKYKTYFATLLRDFDKYPNRHPEFPDSAILFVKTNSRMDEVSKLLKGHKSTKRLSFRVEAGYTFNEPSVFYFDWQTANCGVDKSYERYQLSVSLPLKNFLVDLGRKRNQEIAINIEPMGEFGYEGHTLKLPFLSGFNEFFSRQVAFDPWKLKVGKDGITLIEEQNRDFVTVFPIAQDAIILEIFKQAGFTDVATSHPGRIAKNIVKQMGNLEDCRVFKMECVRKLLSSPDSISRASLNQTIKIDAVKHKDLILVRGQKEATPTKSDVIKHLLDKKLISIGYSLKCSNCGLMSWFSLKQIDAVWVCQYCDASNDASQQIYDNKSTDFQTSGLFQLEKKRQEGSIPVILTLLLLQRTIRDFGFLFSTALTLKLTEAYEIDFCVIEQLPRDHSVKICIGECKENGEIDDNDIANLKLIREKLIQLGMECYLIFSKIAKFTDAETARFKVLQTENIPIILLTGAELDEPMQPYWNSKDPSLPQKHAVSLEDLQRNSAYLYLR